ncbi:MAG: nucleotidyltransferase domain-containing protein [Bdellovibrio sp.]
MAERFGISQKVIEDLNHIFRCYPQIQKVILYGSRAKGNYKAGSDIDLTLVAPSLNLSDVLRIENEIDDLLLPYKVDLSLYHHIDNSGLLDHIERVGVEFK